MNWLAPVRDVATRTPEHPNAGDRIILPTAAIVEFHHGRWHYYNPRPGDSVYVENLSQVYIFGDYGGWTALTSVQAEQHGYEVIDHGPLPWDGLPLGNHVDRGV